MNYILMNFIRMSRTNYFSCLLFSLALSLIAFESAHAQDDAAASTLPSWEYTPYRLQIYLGSRDQSVPAAELETTLAALRPLVERAWRGSWQTGWAVGAAPAVAATPAGATAPDSEADSGADSSPASAPSGPVDQIIEIDLLQLGAETRVQVRFRDNISGRAGEPLQLLAANAADIPKQTILLLKAGFSPLARVAKYEQGQAVLRIKGGKLLGIDNQFAAGSVLLPLERTRTEDGSASAARALKWTLLGVTRVNGAQLVASVHSGLPQAGDPGDSRPIDFLAQPLQSVRAETELTILGMSPAVAAINNDLPAEEQAKAVATISQAKVPLAGIRVTARAFDQPTRVTWSGVTDKQGKLRLPARWDASVGAYRAQLWLLDVGAGGETLATLPCCPGAMEKITLALPANPQWVAAQQWLEDTRELVLQIHARRKIQIARIVEAQKNKQTAELGRLQTELRLLPDAGKVLQNTPVLTLIPEGVEGTAALAILQKRQLAALLEIREFAKSLGGVLPADPNLPVVPMAAEPMPGENPDQVNQ